MLDLTKLTPSPWEYERRYSNGCEIIPRIKCAPSNDRKCGWVADLIGAPYLGYESTLANAEFIALARNAFDVMMQWGWFTIPTGKMWVAAKLSKYDDPVDLPGGLWPDPFTALVEADKWYREHVEKS